MQNLMLTLLALQILATCVSIYANTTGRRLIANWAGSAAFVLLATLVWVDGAPRSVAYLSYSIGAFQAGTAIFMHVRGQRI